MSNDDVIPTKDPAFDTFQENLVSKCNTNAAVWGIPATELTNLTPVQSDWAAAWLIAKVKNNRTPAQVTAKDLARANYEAILRPFIQKWIYLNALMSNTNIEECGLKPRDKNRTPSPIPTQVPVINIQYAPGNKLDIRFFRIDDESGAIRRGKPKGVSRIQFVYIFNTQPTSPDQCNKLEEASRSPLHVNVDPSQRGQRVWFYARWVNTRNQYGTWTNLDSFLM